MEDHNGWGIILAITFLSFSIVSFMCVFYCMHGCNSFKSLPSKKGENSSISSENLSSNFIQQATEQTDEIDRVKEMALEASLILEELKKQQCLRETKIETH